jgi:hypothetical protein
MVSGLPDTVASRMRMLPSPGTTFASFIERGSAEGDSGPCRTASSVRIVTVT